MHIDSLFPSKYLAAADLNGKDLVLTIDSWEIDAVGIDEEQRPILHFKNAEKGMVLNRTNADTISAMYGPEVDDWVGKPITIYPTTTRYGKKTVACIRVREAKLQTPPPSSPPAAPVMTPEMVQQFLALMQSQQTQAPS